MPACVSGVLTAVVRDAGEGVARSLGRMPSRRVGEREHADQALLCKLIGRLRGEASRAKSAAENKFDRLLQCTNPASVIFAFFVESNVCLRNRGSKIYFPDPLEPARSKSHFH